MIVEGPRLNLLLMDASMVAVVAGRWVRTTGRVWAAPSPVITPAPTRGPRWAPRAADIAIAAMGAEHAEHVLAIYQAGLDTDNASFETDAPPWAWFDAAHLAAHRFVACDRRTGAVLGWVALAAVSTRPVYSGANGIWTLQAGIFPENLASIALHRAHGFRIVGVRERIARHRGRWRNMLLLERRDGGASRPYASPGEGPHEVGHGQARMPGSPGRDLIGSPIR